MRVGGGHSHGARGVCPTSGTEPLFCGHQWLLCLIHTALMKPVAVSAEGPRGALRVLLAIIIAIVVTIACGFVTADAPDITEVGRDVAKVLNLLLLIYAFVVVVILWLRARAVPRTLLLALLLSDHGESGVRTRSKRASRCLLA